MTRYLYYAITLGLVAAATPLRAADRQHAEGWREKDLGPNTTKLAQAMTVYDPDPSWHTAE